MGNGKRREEKEIATAREKKSLAGRTMQSKEKKEGSEQIKGVPAAGRSKNVGVKFVGSE